MTVPALEAIVSPTARTVFFAAGVGACTSAISSRNRLIKKRQ
jgi:hypothetical protein